MNGAVYSLTTFDDDGAGPHATALYAGGAFTKAGGTTVNYIAKWNGSAWTKVGKGVDGSSIVFALTSFNGGLIVGGQFATTGGGTVTPGIARWNGTTWSALGNGMNNTVMSLATYNDGFYGTALYAGGYFTAASNVPNTAQIARWSAGTGTWPGLGEGMVVVQGQLRSVYALTTFGYNHLYAGGFCQVAPAPPGDGYFGEWSGCE